MILKSSEFSVMEADISTQRDSSPGFLDVIVVSCRAPGSIQSDIPVKVCSCYEGG